MSYILNIPFGNLKFYQGNALTNNVAYFHEISSGGKIHIGSDWMYDSSSSRYRSTVFDVAKIKIKISDLGLSQKFPKNTKINFSILNTSDWCGAGYLRGHVSKKDLPLSQVVNWNGSTGQMITFDSNIDRFCFCEADFTSGHGSSGRIVTFTGTCENEVDLTNTEYIYIYVIDTVVHFGSPGSTSTSFNSSYLKVNFDLPYTQVGNPTNFTVVVDNATSDNSNINIYYDSNINLSWTSSSAGNNNPVAGYKLYYKTSEEVQAIGQIINAESVNFSFISKNLIPVMKKGSTYQLGIQALASYENLHSSIVYFNKYLNIVNKAPDAPSFTITDIIRCNDNSSSQIEIKNLTAYDVDGDSLEYQYQILNANGVVSSEGTVPSNRKITMTKQTPFIQIKAVETSGSEAKSSVWTKKQVVVNSKPTFSFSYTPEIGLVGSKAYLNILRNIKCDFGNHSSPLTFYEWKIGTDLSLVNIGNTSTIDYYKIIPAAIGQGGGQQVKIILTIKDKTGDSFSEQIYLTYNNDSEIVNLLCPQKRTPRNLIISSSPITNNNEVSSIYIDKFFQAKIITDQPSDEIDRFISLYIKEKDGTYKLVFNSSSKISDGLNNYSNLTYNLVDGRVYIFKAVLTDLFGNTTECESTEYNYLQSFNVSTFNYSRQNWYPVEDYYDKTNQIVFFTSSFLDMPNNIGNNYYTIEAIYNNSTIILANKIGVKNSQDWTIEINGSTINFKKDNLDLFKKLQITTDSADISIQYKITGFNAFGRAGASLFYSGKIITSSAPSVNDITLTSYINSDAKENYKNWFNPGDSITFSINKIPFDYNDYLYIENGKEITSGLTSIQKYELSYRYDTTQTWTKIQEGEYSYNLSFNINSIKPLNKGLDATNVQFGLRFIDKSGLSSDYLTIDLVACREINPSFSIQNSSILSKTLSISLISTDLGGNSKGKENFLRNGGETFKTTLYISIDDINYSPYVGLINNYSDPSNNLLNNNLEIQTTLTKGEEQNSKIYIKAVVEITTNSVTGRTIQIETLSYLFYLNAPTMSHRRHWIGINTTANNNEDVFHISQFDEGNEERKIIRLSGFNNVLGKEREITIDLSSGILTGYDDGNSIMKINLSTGEIDNAIISGGTW